LPIGSVLSRKILFLLSPALRNKQATSIPALVYQTTALCTVHQATLYPSRCSDRACVTNPVIGLVTSICYYECSILYQKTALSRNSTRINEKKCPAGKTRVGNNQHKGQPIISCQGKGRPGMSLKVILRAFELHPVCLGSLFSHSFPIGKHRFPPIPTLDPLPPSPQCLPQP